ncbi:Ig-like domain-containing protein [Blautia difficilis]|uniref:Ig-like domain-containing protein n=1 Tax=Blautia difficilis TaxID=2763027 RepID=UPI003D9840DD
MLKKKLIALLLASSMVLAGFVSVYGAEDFTDSGDGATMESVTENEWDEDCFSDTEDGDFTSEESGDALFSDEKEIPAVQNGEVCIENAGQGMTAGTSVYNSKSSFGRRKTFPQLADMGNSPGSYSLNWANPEYTSYYTDTAGNLHIVAWKNQILYDVSCNPDLNITSVTKVKLQLPLWGGFYAAPDGNFYVVTGQKNLDENDRLTVVRVLKYDRTWKLLGATDISGDYTNMFKGIYIPFDGASLRMTQIGSTLIVHTGREMYGMDGIHHQSDVTFVINTQDMTLINSDMPYCSHSFNQFVVNDGYNVYFLDHGDAYDRGLILSSFSASSDGHIAQRSAVNIFPFMGPAGQNYTGCQVTGFSLAGDNLITVGRSVPHSFSVNGLTGYEDLNLNAFMIITDKNSKASRFIWLTQYSPSGDVIRLTEPKLIPVGNNQYAVLFSDETSKQSVLHYLLMDGSGNILLSKLYKNVTIQTDSQPILWGRNIVWTSGNYDNHNYDGTETFLYEIPVVTTPLSGIALDQTSLTLDEGKTQKLTPSFAPVDSDDVKDMSWTSSNPKIVSVSADGTIKGNGYGQAVITASTGEFQAQCQVTVRVSETDDPLATPTLKLSQKAANKMRLIWKKVPGAKGYQIYCKTNAQSSYKRIKTLKTGTVSYDVNRSPSSRQLKKYKFFLPVEIYLLAVLCSLQVNFVFFHWC